MASVHKINETLARVRGVPLATIEAYSRVLRREGVLPETKRGGGATQLEPQHASYMLAAVMMGSPTLAAENAREVGGLIVHDGGALLEPVLRRQLEALKWPDDMSFAQAIGWFIERFSDGKIFDFVLAPGKIQVKIDRYWTSASIRWLPTEAIVQGYLQGWQEAFPDINPPPVPELRPDGTLRDPMEIGFHSPLLHQAKVTYETDPERNSEAHRVFLEKKRALENLDLWGTETVTNRTLLALSELFRK